MVFYSFCAQLNRIYNKKVKNSVRHYMIKPALNGFNHANKDFNRDYF